MSNSNTTEHLQETFIESPSTRRKFLQSGAAVAATTLVSGGLRRAFADAHAEHGQAIQFGYSEITWGSDFDGAVRDISAVGFPGIQIRIVDLGDKISGPPQVKAAVQQHGLTIVALSSGGVTPDRNKRAAEVALHLQHAQFARDTGCLYLQLVAGREKKRPPVPDDYKYEGGLLSEIGREAADLGIKTTLHNHHGSLCQSTEELDLFMANTDPQYLKLELDIAHYTAGGGNPVQAIDKYHDRLLFLHLKDMLPMKDGEKPRFVELGNGIVDIPGSMKALARHRFHGWAVVELDKEEVNPARPPRQSAEISKRYIENTLKLRV